MPITPLLYLNIRFEPFFFKFTFTLPVEYNPHSQHWLLLDRIVQQIILQTTTNTSNSTSSQENINSTDKSSTLSIDQTSSINSNGKVNNPDVTAIDINVAEIVQLLAKEEELVAARAKAETLEKENTDVNEKLAQKVCWENHLNFCENGRLH